jgi:hypothetical protein
MSNTDEAIDATTDFVCPTQPSLSIGVDVDGSRQQLVFAHHKLTLEGEAAKVLKALLKTNLRLGALVRIVDKAEAEAIARAHMAKARAVAANGTMSSEMAKGREQTAIEDLRQQGATEAQLAELQRDMADNENLVLTEKVDLGAVAGEQSVAGKEATDTGKAGGINLLHSSKK